MLQDKDIFTIFAAGLEGTASPLYEIKNTIVKKDPKNAENQQPYKVLCWTLTDNDSFAPRVIFRAA